MDNLEVPQGKESVISPPDERLVKKLESLRRDLAIPGSDPRLSKMELYRTVWNFDPFQVQVGKGYRPLISTYDEAVEMIAQDTAQAKAKDFALFMNEEAMAGPTKGFTYNRRADTNPMLVFSSSAAQSIQFGFGSGYLITAGIDKSVLIDHNETRWNFGWEARYNVEDRIYLYGPLHPTWILGVHSLEAAKEREEDGERASYNRRIQTPNHWVDMWPAIRTVLGIQVHLRVTPDEAPIDGSWTWLDKNKYEKEFYKIRTEPNESDINNFSFPDARQAIKQAILLDGVNNKKTYKEGVKPIVKVESLDELKTCLDVFKDEGLLLGDKKPEDVWVQVVKYVKGEAPIKDVVDPFIQDAVVRIAFKAIQQGRNRSSLALELSNAA